MDTLPARITVVGPMPPYRGGIAHFTTSLMRTLAFRGHRVLGINFRRQYPGLLFPGKTQYEDHDIALDVPVQRTLDSIAPWSWFDTGRRIRAWRPQAVVYAHWMPFFAPAYGSVLRTCGRGGIRHLGLVHNAIPHEPRPGDRVLNRWFLRACDGHLVLSEEVERDLRRLGFLGPIARGRHPVYDLFGERIDRNEARRRLGLDADAQIVLFFGYVRPYKGLDLLIEAFSRARTPGRQLLVVGEFYEGEEAARRQIAALGLSGRVRLHPEYVPSEEVGLWFGASDLVVQPYRTATQSGVAQVAFHFGRPLIVTDVGGLAEIVPDGEAGLVVPPEDPAALAAAIDRFFEEGLGPRLEQGVERLRARDSWAALAEKLESLLA